jgi:uncharacterized coiled-coil protein SlyX
MEPLRESNNSGSSAHFNTTLTQQQNPQDQDSRIHELSRQIEDLQKIIKFQNEKNEFLLTEFKKINEGNFKLECQVRKNAGNVLVVIQNIFERFSEQESRIKNLEEENVRLNKNMNGEHDYLNDSTEEVGNLLNATDLYDPSSSDSESESPLPPAKVNKRSVSSLEHDNPKSFCKQHKSRKMLDHTAE